ncbi:MAG: TonB-dependent receptor [Firmicutes bacterium]|nr:TonB-dependent receptor [Bacillota bacterium]
MKERRRLPVFRLGITGFFCFSGKNRSPFGRTTSWLPLLTVITLLALVFLPVAGADETEAVEVIEFEGIEEEVVVTAARFPLRPAETPGLTIVVDREALRQSTGNNLSALVAEAGFPVAASGGDFAQASIQLGGFSANQSLLLFNGVPVNPGPTGEVDLSLFPTATLDRMEISRGPLSPLYGANAMGGVVNIETALSGEERSGFLLGGGSFGSGEMNVFLKSKQWGLAAGGGRSAGYLPNSATNKSYFSGEYSFRAAGENSDRLVLQGHLLMKEAEIPGSTVFPSTGSQYDQRLILNLSGRKEAAANLWEYRVFTQTWDNRYNSDFGADRHRVEGHGAELSLRREAGNHILLAGISLAHDNFHSTKSGRNSRTQGAVYLQDHWAIRRDLILLTGLRWDESSDYGAALSPRLSLVKHLTGDLTLKAGYGRAFRPPTVNELYWHEDYGIPERNMFGNPDLRPEKGESYDLTLHWQDRAGGTLTAGVFRSRLTDGIAWVQRTEGYKTQNIDGVRISGFDLRWERKAKNGFGGDFTYTWLNRQDWKPETGYVKNTRLGEHRVAIGITYTRGPWQARGYWRLVEGRTPQKTPDGVVNIMPDYHLLDTVLIYRTRGGFELKMAVNNLLDTAYEINAGYPMPGRNLEVSLYHAF